MAKICIDAGHGGKFNNAVSYDGVQEKTENLMNALALQKILITRKHTVIMTRAIDKELAPALSADLNKRCEISNNNKCDCFISLHENGYSDPDANGVEVIFGTNASTKSIAWANDCLDRLVKASGLRRRRTFAQGITVMTKTNAPCILVEFGFMTNKNDMNTIRTKRTAMLNAIADSIEVIFGTCAVPPEPTKPVAPVLQYTLLSGAQLWRNVGEGKIGTVVTLDAYPTAEEPSGVYARIIDEKGNHYLVPWTKLKKR